MVSNRDIGFVRAGDRAEIKVDTLNFTRYGLLHGDVLNVSSDAVDREAQTRPGEEGAAKTPAPAARRELSTRRGSRSTALPWTSTAGPSICGRAWRSRPRSTPAPEG